MEAIDIKGREGAHKLNIFNEKIAIICILNIRHLSFESCSPSRVVVVPVSIVIAINAMGVSNSIEVVNNFSSGIFQLVSANYCMAMVCDHRIGSSCRSISSNRE